MNKEIKFQGKRKDNGEWIHGNLLLSEKQVNGAYKAFIVIPFAHIPDNLVLEVYPDSVHQYTGFEDKNGREIFLGNITRQKLEDFMCEKGWYWWYGEVKEVNGCMVINQLDFDYSKCKFPIDYTFLFDEASNIEVIGKAFDKPKLKKQCEHY